MNHSIPTLLTVISSILLSTAAHASDLKVVTCWNGYSNADQQNGLASCKKQARDGQKCSLNLWEHKHAAYDVCLLEPQGPMKIVATFKGFSQKEQNSNLKQCLAQEGQQQICVTNMWTHKQAAFDVCLMESEEPPTESKPAAPTPAAADTTPKAKSTSMASYLSNGTYCYNVDTGGKLFGSAVADSKCHTSYLSNGTYCYNVDANGRLYGSAVADSWCHASYLSNGTYCYNVDSGGKLYGSAVADARCRR